VKRRFRISGTTVWFLIARFCEPFFLTLAGFAGIYLLADFFDRFDDLMRHHGFGWLAVEYFALKLPLITAQMMPVACLAAGLMSFSMLNRTGEVLAFQALGVSRWAMVAPLLVLGLVISMADFGLSETIVPQASRRAHYVYMVRIKKWHLVGVFANRKLWIRTLRGFLSADHYDASSKVLEGVTLYHIDSSFKLKDVQIVKRALWTGHDWRLEDVTEMRVKPDGGAAYSTINEKSADVAIGARPSDLSLLRRDPEEFSLSEINRYIHDLRRKGIDPGGYLVDRDLKFALPMACVIMVALALALSLDPAPRNVSLGRSFVLGIGIGFSYWLVLGFTASFARGGIIAPWLGAWTPNLIFAVIAFALFLFGEER
jgi:lipopolysaccharide export system permease protein